ncbi:MAG: polysaccharide biosynthesis/export family protein [Nitrospirales bacterium]|nr:polysaccharide biosynthesis/export family protein [Nitrospirales bacterium]
MNVKCLNQTLSTCLVILLIASFTGCTSGSGNLKETQSTTTTDFFLGPEDVLEITVWRNQDLSRQTVVRPDGMVSMPLIGDVQASGLTANQLAARIAERLKEFKESPSVSVSVKEVNSYNIFVLGEVQKPGKYQLKSNTSVLQAIAVAGGFTIYASKNKMQVVTTEVNGDGHPHEVRIPVRYNELLSGEGERGNFVLKSGDIVVVP